MSPDHLFYFFNVSFSDSSCTGSTEESEMLKRQRSLYIDLGALAGYFNLVRGPPTLEYG